MPLIGRPPRYWRHLKEMVVQPVDPQSPLVDEQMKLAGVDRETAIRQIDTYNATTRIFRNDRYQVQSRDLDNGLVHINIRRTDGAAVHDWRDLQQIKNEVLGPECEAIELYPAEDRKVDSCNKYHLWGMRDPAFRFPVGFDEADVQDGDMADAKLPGLRQRPL